MSTSCSAVKMGRDGGSIGQTSTSCSAVRMGRDGETNGQARTSWIRGRISKSGEKISLRSLSMSGVRRISKENMTYENFLPGQQKNQYITLSNGANEDGTYILITEIFGTIVEMTTLPSSRTGSDILMSLNAAATHG